MRHHLLWKVDAFQDLVSLPSLGRVTGLQWNVGKFEFPSQVKPVPRMSSPTQAMKENWIFSDHMCISGNPQINFWCYCHH